MATNYMKGRDREYTVKKALEAFGYTCTRSASSQGLWDVVGVGPRDVVLVQAKLTSQARFSEDANCKALRALAVAPNVRKELWVFRPGKSGAAEVWLLEGELPKARSEARDTARTEATERAERFNRALRMVT